MSIVEEKHKLHGDSKEEKETLQWSSFKAYDGISYTLEKRRDLKTVKSLFENTFLDQNKDEEIAQCKELTQECDIRDLKSYLYKSQPCSNNDRCGSNNMTCESEYKHFKKEKAICTWQALLQSYFKKKPVTLMNSKWRKNFALVLSMDVVECGECFGKNYHVLDLKPDPMYSRFGKLGNGFYISFSGLVFSSEIELKNFNLKMEEVDKKFSTGLSEIQRQHSKLKAKAEETKLLSQGVESQEESDQDDEPKENQQLNKQNKVKDKVERKSGLFASLTASLSAARSGIQGFLEKSGSPKENRRSPHDQKVPTVDNDDSEDETGKLTHSNLQSTTHDGIDNHDEFTRQMEAKGGFMYESANRTVHQLTHDALPPPLSLQTLQERTSQTEQQGC